MMRSASFAITGVVPTEKLVAVPVCQSFWHLHVAAVYSPLFSLLGSTNACPRRTAGSPRSARIVLSPPAGHVETMSHLERKGQKHSRSPPAVSGGCYHRRLRSYDCEALLGTRWPETQLRKLRMCSSADPPARAPVVVIVDSICDAQGRTRMYDAAADISDII
jgi:hypothetical protein